MFGNNTSGQPPSRPLNVRLLTNVTRVSVSSLRPNLPSASSDGTVVFHPRYPSAELVVTGETLAKRSRVEAMTSGDEPPNKDEKKFVCQSCPFHISFPNEEVYLRHMDLAHVNNPTVLRAQGITLPHQQQTSNNNTTTSANARQVGQTRANLTSDNQNSSAARFKGGFHQSQSALALLNSMQPKGLAPELVMAPNDTSPKQEPTSTSTIITTTTATKKSGNKKKRPQKSPIPVQLPDESAAPWVPDYLKQQQEQGDVGLTEQDVVSTKKGKRKAQKKDGATPAQRQKTSKSPKQPKSKKKNATPVNQVDPEQLPAVCEEIVVTTSSMADESREGGPSSSSCGGPAKKGRGRKPKFCCIVEGCNGKFEKGEDLFDHVKANHGRKQAFICGTCYAMFIRAFHFVSHMLDTKHEDRYGGMSQPMDDPSVEDQFASAEALDPNVKRFSCPSCKQQFLDRANLTQHKQTVHPERTCRLCGATFKNKYYLKKHRKMVHPQQMLQKSPPKQAGEESKSEDDEIDEEEDLPVSLNTSLDLGSPRALSSGDLVPALPHASILIEMNEEDERALISDVLGDATEIAAGSSSSPSRSAQAPDSFSVFSCEHCLILCLSAQELEQHIRTSHPNVLQSPTSGSDATTPVLQKLLTQQPQKTRKAKKRSADSASSSKRPNNNGASSTAGPNVNWAHVCPVCSKSYQTAESLLHHSRLSGHGRSDLPYKCPLCPRSFDSQRGVTKHNQKCHRKGGVSAVASTTKIDLINQRQTETGTKFLCKFCPKSFLARKTYVAHLKKQHPESGGIVVVEKISPAKPPSENRFACNLCSSVFAKMYRLRRHKKNVHKIIEETPTTVVQSATNVMVDQPSSCTPTTTEMMSKMVDAEMPIGVEEEVVTEETVVECVPVVSDSQFLCEMCSMLFADHLGLFAHYQEAHPEIGSEPPAQISSGDEVAK